MDLEKHGIFRQELEVELRGNILFWWMEHMPDMENGGFYGHLRHSNEVVEKAGKGAILNARILWAFSAAFRSLPDKAYLEMADRAYGYIMEHFLDPEYGGVYWELDYKGGVASSRKQIYALAFTIYALSEYYMATGKEEALEKAFELFHDIEKHARDRKNNGYTDALSRSWKPIEDLRLSEKDDNESKTMNTHLHILEAYGNLYRCRKDPELGKALENTIGLFLTYFVDKEKGRLNLFFDDDWNLKSSIVSFGHDIECSWLLHEAAEILGNPELISLSSELAVRMAKKTLEGMDSDGGLFYEYFPDEKELDTDKHWWPQAEAMVGYFNAWQISGDSTFAQHALNSWEFIKTFLVDREFGEWYWSVSSEGKPQRSKEKAGFWKCPYHNGRACLELMMRIDKL